MPTYHLAQINIAQMVDTLESETMSGFVARLDEINALADDAPGFVWRLQTEEFLTEAMVLMWGVSRFDLRHISVNSTMAEETESIFGNVKVGNTVCVCLRIRRRSAVHPQSIQMERKNNKRGKEALSSLFFCHKMDMGMKVDQSVF